MGRSSAGPSEQFTPMPSIPMSVKVRAMASMSVPVKVRPLASKLMVRNTGRSLFSFAASTAAFAS